MTNKLTKSDEHYFQIKNAYLIHNPEKRKEALSKINWEEVSQQLDIDENRFKEELA